MFIDRLSKISALALGLGVLTAGAALADPSPLATPLATTPTATTVTPSASTRAPAAVIILRCDDPRLAASLGGDGHPCADACAAVSYLVIVPGTLGMPRSVIRYAPACGDPPPADFVQAWGTRPLPPADFYRW